jgi:O-antigen/teichoic acid export membrane protein
MPKRIGDLARHAGVYGIGTIAGGVARIALVPVVARYVPTGEYGKVSVVLVFITLLTIVSELGFSSSLIKFINETTDEQRRRTVVGTVLAGSMLLLLPLVAVCIASVSHLSRLLLGSAEYVPLVVIGIAAGAGNAMLQTGLAVERAFARSGRYVLYTLIKGGLALTLSIILVVALRKGALGLLLGSAVPPVLIALVIYGRLISSYAARFSGEIFRRVLAFGGPLMPMNLAMWVLAYSDIYLLRRLSGEGALSEVGLYQYAHEICLVLVLPITSLNLAWPQFLFAHYSEQGSREMFARVQVYFAFFLVQIGFLLSMFSREIIALVGSPEYGGSSSVIPLLAGSLVFYGLGIVFASGLYVVGRTGVLAGIAGCCAGLNVALNLALIPHLGKEGAAAATLLTNMVMAGAILISAQRRYRIPFGLVRTLAGIGLAASVVFAFTAPQGLWTGGLWVRVAAGAGVCLGQFAVFGIRPGETAAALRTLIHLRRPRAAR